MPRPITQTVSFEHDATGRATFRRIPEIRLTVVRGPDKKKELSGALPSVRIGSGEGADLKLSDPTVSALHCYLRADETGFRLRDLGAKNGVLLADHRIVEAWLVDGDRFALGETVIKFELLGEARDETLSDRASFGRLVGASPVMRALYAQLERAARSDAPVLIQGETGTGKELAAEGVAMQGRNKDGALVVVDCGRLPPGTAESELFGHEAGAFSGAVRRHEGAFERAHGGTLFLDEIGDLPRELQPKLLGALERKTFTRVGGREPVAFSARVISATHRDLERAVNAGTFRADLYYRLAALTVRMPSLRERAEDIPVLVSHFLDELPGAPTLPPAALERLFTGDYPGNVRELGNAVERAVAGIAPAPSLPAGVAVDVALPWKPQKERLLDGFERAYFEKLFAACSGNVSELARKSGLSRFHAHELVRRLGLKRPAR